MPLTKAGARTRFPTGARVTRRAFLSGGGMGGPVKLDPMASMLATTQTIPASCATTLRVSDMISLQRFIEM
jgi:hypothetical protein